MSDAPAAPMQKSLNTAVIGLPMIALGGMQLMAVLDGTVANLALAPLQRELDLSDAGRNWVLTSYALAFGGLMLLGGRVGDALGRKKVFIGGVSLFTVASLLCGLAFDQYSLVAARALQGVGAAIAMPTAFALVATTFAAGKARNQAIAAFAAMTGIGSVTGLIVGGALTQVSWRWIFLINVPIGALIIAIAVIGLRETAHERLALDVPGAVLGTAGCTAIVFGISEGPELGWSSYWVLGALGAGCALLVAFLFAERTAEHPLLPFALFRDRDRVFTFAAIFLASAVMFIMAAYVAQFVQNILGYSPLRAGLAFLPFAAGLGTGSALSSKLCERIEPRWLVAFGAALMAGGLGYAATLDGSATYWTNMFAIMLGVGFGVGVAVVPLPLCAVAGVVPSEIGPLTAITQVVQTLGGPLALAVVGAMATSRTMSRGGTGGSPAEMNPAQLAALSEGYTFALACCAVLALLGGLVALFIRYTPQQVAQAQAAQEAVQAGS